MAKKFDKREAAANLDQVLAPELTKAPPKPVSRADKQRVELRHGKPKTYRLPPDLVQAVDVAAKSEGLPTRDLVEFFLRSGLYMLANGRLSLPTVPDEGATVNRVSSEGYPEIPEGYRH